MARLVLVVALVLGMDSVTLAKCGVPTTKRGEVARKAFMRTVPICDPHCHLYPNGRKGYVVDHILALCKGGLDSPDNMQWQTVAEAKAKDRVECRCDLPPFVR